MAEILLAVLAWCMADPYPYKTVAQCRQQLLQCVRDTNRYSQCFERIEDLKDPKWNKEKQR